MHSITPAPCMNFNGPEHELVLTGSSGTTTGALQHVLKGIYLFVGTLWRAHRAPELELCSTGKPRRLIWTPGDSRAHRHGPVILQELILADRCVKISDFQGLRRALGSSKSSF